MGIEPTTLAWTLRLERVLDTDPCDRLPRVEILREKSLRARLCGRRDDEGVPKSDSCLVLDTKGCCDVGRADLDTPDRLRADDEPGRVSR